MKIKMQANDLADLVNVCSMAISAKPMKPIYECVHLSAKSEDGIPTLTMVGKDVGTAIRKVTDRAVVEEDGEALIPARKLLSYLKLMDGEISLNVDEKFSATLKEKGKKVTILCMNPEEYEPGLTEMENAQEVRMDSFDFETLINSVSHCVSADNGRMVLTGVNLAFDGAKETNGAESVGLDGFRMAIARRNVETNDTFSAILPGTSAKLVCKIIKGGKNVSFRFGNGVMIAENFDTTIEVSQLAGEYMDYKKLAARNATLRIKADTDKLLNAVSMARIGASEGKKELIVFTLKDEDTLEISAMGDLSGAVSAIPCMAEGQLTKGDGTSDGAEIAFNGRYIEEALKAEGFFGEEVVLECKSSVSPMVIVPAEKDDYFQLVLPVRRL